MSNLLNNNKKKKLLDRGPKIMPAQEFKLDKTPNNTASPTPQVEPKAEPKAEPKVEPKVETKAVGEQTSKKVETTQITSVRVTKSTRNKLNALIQLGKADNVDILIDTMIENYIHNSLLDDEKKTLNFILDIIEKRQVLSK